MFQTGLTKFRKTISKVISGFNAEDFMDELFDVTGSLLSPFKKGLDTAPRYFYDFSASDQTVISYSNQFLTATGAFANTRKGDNIIFKTGTNADIEVQILKKVSNDLAIIVDCDLTITAGDTFRIWRSRVPSVSQAGLVLGSTTVTPATKAPLAKVKKALLGVTESTYTELFSTVGATAITQIQVFSNTGESFYLAYGAALSEVDKLIIPPGMNQAISLDVPANTRLSIKSVSAPEVAFVDEFLIVNLAG